MEVKKQWYKSHIVLASLAIAVAGIYLFFQMSGISPELIEQAKSINPDLAALFEALKNKAWGGVLAAVLAVYAAVRRIFTANPPIVGAS